MTIKKMAIDKILIGPLLVFLLVSCYGNRNNDTNRLKGLWKIIYSEKPIAGNVCLGFLPDEGYIEITDSSFIFDIGLSKGNQQFEIISKSVLSEYAIDIYSDTVYHKLTLTKVINDDLLRVTSSDQNVLNLERVTDALIYRKRNDIDSITLHVSPISSNCFGYQFSCKGKLFSVNMKGRMEYGAISEQYKNYLWKIINTLDLEALRGTYSPSIEESDIRTFTLTLFKDGKKIQEAKFHEVESPSELRKIALVSDYVVYSSFPISPSFVTRADEGSD